MLQVWKEDELPLLQPAEGQNQSKAAGLIIPDIINPFFGELVKAIEGEATEQGYTVLLGNTDFSMEKEERYLSIFLAKRVDGIILVTTAQTAGEHYQRLKKYSVPLLCWWTACWRAPSIRRESLWTTPTPFSWRAACSFSIVTRKSL
ncbi:MAG: substrate-binding domain-containing protein [Flavonifractor plautii]